MGVLGRDCSTYQENKNKKKRKRTLVIYFEEQNFEIGQLNGGRWIDNENPANISLEKLWNRIKIQVRVITCF